LSSFLEVKTLYVSDRAQWRAWLAKNHAIEDSGIWLVYYKQQTGKPSLNYDESVEEALCFGWVDSLIKRLDEEKYARRFTPRKPGSAWSDSNQKRIAKLAEQGLLAAPGIESVRLAKLAGTWDEDGDRLEDIPEEFSKSLLENHAARVYFEKLKDRQRLNYIRWINQARQEATRRRRIRESISLLEQGRVLGMK